MNALVAIGCVLAGAAAQVAPVEVQVTLAPAVIPFHRQAQYTIIVDVTGDAGVELPDMIDKFGGLSVYDVQRATLPLKGGRRRVTETYILDPVLAGTYAIAPVEVAWTGGSAVIVPSPALRVRDLTEEERAAAEQFADNASPLGLPAPVWLRWWFWAAAVGAAALIGGAVAWWFRRREEAQRAAPPPPSWEVAYARLRDLDQRHLPQAGKFEPYYVDLSAVLRYYIEDRFQLHAPEQTTPEFLDAAARSGALDETHQRVVAQFLRHCDRVKFARYEPTLEEMERGFEVVLRFVDETVPRPEADREEAAA